MNGFWAGVISSLVAGRPARYGGLVGDANE